MNILLDTHAFLWWVEGSPRFSQEVLALIERSENPCLLSVASCWEMAIKAGLGKLRLACPVREYVPRHLAANLQIVADILSAGGRSGTDEVASP